MKDFLRKNVPSHTTYSFGFTLIEVLVSFTLIIIFGFSFLFILGNSLKTNDFNAEKVEATLLAQSQLEAIRAERDLALSDNKQYQLGTLGEQLPHFSIHVDKKEKSPTLIEVTITVAPLQSSSPLKPVVLTSQLYIGEEESEG
ncbi:type IV pilus modification PilV family protein [Alkalihalobacillus pseudalcaliphilus]|uniref:type IV pilus modification PilV family protein n=1 Tax=Alkalihalobacillus pseudalcaliphilus TaxID=79884 RepID=UPI00064D8C70|nr:hypothetical protein [Alkalihalobacillus pseudalcaliphilus]KMK74655.1 hypothetical protein AB990_19355 [Alkalihalobacillus pseudalcaliphilus]